MAFVFAPLFSGSSGNAQYVEYDGNAVLVDAGMAGRRIENELAGAGSDISRVHAILITHEHVDHIGGVGVLARRYRMDVYATEPTWRAMQPKLGTIPPECVHTVVPGQPFELYGMTVSPFAIPHDAAGPVGYTFCADGLKLGIATDLGHIEESWLESVAGSELLLLEANHDVEMLRAGRYPYELKMRILGANGHLSNDDAGLAAVQLAGMGVKNIILGHLSHENNFPELAWESVASQLRDAGAQIPLGVARRDGLTGVYRLDALREAR